MTKLKNSNCEITSKLRLGQKSNFDKTQIVTKLKLGQNSNWDKSQVVTKKIVKKKTKKLNVTKLKL